jgi:hypothetical protein
VTDQTQFKKGAALAILQVGDRVKVHYRELADGSRLALKVMEKKDKDDQGEDEGVTLSGPTEAKTADGLVVSGVTVLVPAGTEIVDADAAPLAFADLQEGQSVEVAAAHTAGGLSATRIAVLETVVVSGAVEAGGGETVYVAGTAVAVTEETYIADRAGEERTAEDLTPGALIEVWAVRQAAGAKETSASLVAERITVLRAGVATGVEAGAGDVPGRFVLHANYPNPFNPVTTILFELAASATGPVRLVVYDLLGRPVRTLVDAVLPGGRHQYTWNGLDHAGQPAASGIYLYRLDAGGRTETRSMLLMK